MIVCYEPSTGAWQFQTTYYCALPANNQEGFFYKISPSHISMAWFLTVLLLLVPTCRTNSRPACCLGEIIDLVLRNAWRPGNTFCDHPKKVACSWLSVHLFKTLRMHCHGKLLEYRHVQIFSNYFSVNLLHFTWTQNGRVLPHTL